MNDLPITSNTQPSTSTSNASQKSDMSDALSAEAFGAVLARQVAESNATPNSPSDTETIFLTEPKSTVNATTATSNNDESNPDKMTGATDIQNDSANALIAMLQLPTNVQTPALPTPANRAAAFDRDISSSKAGVGQPTGSLNKGADRANSPPDKIGNTITSADKLEVHSTITGEQQPAVGISARIDPVIASLDKTGNPITVSEQPAVRSGSAGKTRPAVDISTRIGRTNIPADMAGDAATATDQSSVRSGPAGAHQATVNIPTLTEPTKTRADKIDDAITVVDQSATHPSTVREHRPEVDIHTKIDRANARTNKIDKVMMATVDKQAMSSNVTADNQLAGSMLTIIAPTNVPSDRIDSVTTGTNRRGTRSTVADRTAPENPLPTKDSTAFPPPNTLLARGDEGAKTQYGSLTQPPIASGAGASTPAQTEPAKSTSAAQSTQVITSVANSMPTPNITTNIPLITHLPDHQLTLPSPVGSANWPEEFSQKISWISTQKNQVAELHLNPPDLGPLDVTIKISGNQATAQFTSPHSAVRDAVENALPKLRETLADNGIMLGNATVSDQSLADRNAKNFMNQGSNTATHRGTFNEASVSTGSSPAPLQAPPVRRHNGIVDTFA